MNTPTIVRWEIAPRSIAWILATIVGVWLFLQLHVVVLVLVVALVFAGTFNPVVEWMERRGLKRVVALALLFVTLLLLTSLLIFLTFPPLIEQLAQIVHDAPQHRTQIIAFLQERNVTAPLARMLQHTGVEPTFARIEEFLVDSAPRALTALGWAV